MLPRRVLFCIDFSADSEPARELAVDCAKSFGAQLHILHVIDSSGFPSYLEWVGDELAEILKRRENAAQARLEELTKESGLPLGGVKSYCRIGLAPKEIVDLANEQAVDLIVIGAHGRTGVRHLVMGSVAEAFSKQLIALC